MHAAEQTRVLPGFFVHFASYLFGRSASLCNTCIVLPCSLDISSEYQLHKGSCSACWQLYRYTQPEVQQFKIMYTSSLPVPTDITKLGTNLQIYYHSPCILCSASPDILPFLFHKE